MNRSLALYGIIGSICLSTTFATAEQTLREFTSSSGAKMKAQIVSATTEKVTLKLENGRETTGGIQFFSEADQKFIHQWRKANPSQLKYEFELEFNKKREGRQKSIEDNTEIVLEDWLYEIVLTNKSRGESKGTTVQDLKLQVNVVITPKSKSSEARKKHKSLKQKGSQVVATSSFDIDAIDYLKSQTFTTGKFVLATTELTNGYYYTDGSKDRHADDLEGIWIKVVKDGKTVFEEKKGTQELEKMTWATP